MLVGKDVVLFLFKKSIFMKLAKSYLFLCIIAMVMACVFPGQTAFKSSVGFESCSVIGSDR